MMEVIPVIPPDLRPLVPLDGGRFATSDLNDLYRRVINRNNRLKRLQDLNAPEIIIRNEKRMMPRRSYSSTTVVEARPSRATSVAPVAVRHAQGQERPVPSEPSWQARRLLRTSMSWWVLNSACTSAVSPRRWHLALSSRSSSTRLEERGFVNTIKAAKKMVEQEREEVWDILDEVIQEHPVLLNRAPTLHRLGMQGFEPL